MKYAEGLIKFIALLFDACFVFFCFFLINFKENFLNILKLVFGGKKNLLPALPYKQ